jgi:type I restriction enzyme S subunit
MNKWNLPEGWEFVKLGQEEIVTIIMGQSPPGETYNEKEEGLPFFQGKTEFGEYYPTVKKWCTAPKKISEIGDVLISVRAPVGPTNLTPYKCAIGRGLAALRPGKKIILKYLLYVLRSAETELSSYGKGSTFGAISKTDLEEFEIPLPPDLATQQRIVDRIEALFGELNTIRGLHANIQRDTDQLMDAVLAEVFPTSDFNSKYISVPLGEVAKDTSRVNPTLSKKFEIFQYVDISSVDNKNFLITSPKKIVGSEAPSRARKLIKYNDVVFSTTRPYLLNIAGDYPQFIS